MITQVLGEQGRPHETWSNQSFSGGGGLIAYQKARTLFDVSQTGNQSHGWAARIKNSYLVAGMSGSWTETTLVQNDYTYSATDNRLTNLISDVNGPVRTEQYGYDELSRLTSVNYGDGQTQGYSFDPMGNRLTKTDNVTGNETYTVNAANMLLSRNGSSYSNDANGNTLSGGGRSCTWDGQNRMSQCVFNGTTTSHVYGADGLRRQTTKGSDVTDYLLDGQSAVRTLLNGVVDQTFLHGLRGPEYQRVGGNDPAWYLYDGLGSVLGTVNPNGTIISTRKYDVYGSARSSTGPSGTAHKFVGALGHPSEDDTGLVYMRARYYDPATGRFVNPDPAGCGTNLYVYAGANPVCSIDRTGKAAEWITHIWEVASEEFILALAAACAHGRAALAAFLDASAAPELARDISFIVGKEGAIPGTLRLSLLLRDIEMVELMGETTTDLLGSTYVEFEEIAVVVDQGVLAGEVAAETEIGGSIVLGSF